MTREAGWERRHDRYEVVGCAGGEDRESCSGEGIEVHQECVLFVFFLCAASQTLLFCAVGLVNGRRMVVESVINGVRSLTLNAVHPSLLLRSCHPRSYPPSSI